MGEQRVWVSWKGAWLAWEKPAWAGVLSDAVSGIRGAFGGQARGTFFLSFLF